jgi:uncharacterized BrkB/YihY/UPF0761 family membrane protein
MNESIFFYIGVIAIILAIIFFILSSFTKSQITTGKPDANSLKTKVNDYNIVAITMLLLSVIICLPAWIYFHNKNQYNI